MAGRQPISEAIRNAVYVEWKSHPDKPYHEIGKMFNVGAYSVKKFVDKGFEKEREEIRKAKDLIKSEL